MNYNSLILKYKLLLLICILGFTIQPCEQNQENQKMDVKQMEKDIIQKEFGYNFKLEYEHNNCSYEILINDCTSSKGSVPGLVECFGFSNIVGKNNV